MLSALLNEMKLLFYNHFYLKSFNFIVSPNSLKNCYLAQGKEKNLTLRYPFIIYDTVQMRFVIRSFAASRTQNKILLQSLWEKIHVPFKILQIYFISL